MTRVTKLTAIEKQNLFRQARDMIAAGHPWTAVGKTLGIFQETLRARAKREGWFVPKAFEKLNPTPTLKAIEAARIEHKPMPPIGDSLTMAQALLARSLAVLEASPMDEGNARWNILNLPQAIRVLSQLAHPEASDNADCKREYEARLREIEARTLPALTPHDEGEIPASSKEDAA